MKQLIFLIIFLYASPLWTQSQDSTEVKNLILPIAFFLPETSVGLGATGITTIKKSRYTPETRASQILYSAVYTFKKQLLLFAPYEFYGNDNIYRIKGELGYYRYFYNYYGIGASTLRDEKDNYNVIFPRLEFNYSYKLLNNIYLGAGFNFDQFDISLINPLGRLASDKPTGYLGGTKANFTALIFLDVRDNLFSPSKGYYFELKGQINMPDFISDYSYQKLELDFRYYTSIKKEIVLATQLYYGYGSSDSPFFDLPYVSTPARSRGYDDRRFINPTLLNIQTELRFQIYNRWRGVAFVSIADLPDNTWNFFEESPKVSYGIGFRYELDSENKTRLRLDIGSTSESFNIYFTVNEAF